MLFSSCTFYWFQTVWDEVHNGVDRVSTRQLRIVTSEPPRPPSHESEGGAAVMPQAREWLLYYLWVLVSQWRRIGGGQVRNILS